MKKHKSKTSQITVREAVGLKDEIDDILYLWNKLKRDGGPKLSLNAFCCIAIRRELDRRKKRLAKLKAKKKR